MTECLGVLRKIFIVNVAITKKESHVRFQSIEIALRKKTKMQSTDWESAGMRCTIVKMD